MLVYQQGLLIGYGANRFGMKLYPTLVISLMLFFSGSLKAQYSMGVSGLLNTPSADMHTDGAFTGGGNYLPHEMLPDIFYHNTGNYFVNVTFLPFVEMTYRCTFFNAYYATDKKGLQQDRSVSIKLQVLKERTYIPSIAFGSNDAFTTYAINPLHAPRDNRYFASLYGVVTKNIPLGNHRLGFTTGYYFPMKGNVLKNGVFGGIRYVPGFLPQMELMAEYDSEKINIGFSALLFNHIRLHVFSYDFENVSAGIRYEFILIPHHQ